MLCPHYAPGVLTDNSCNYTHKQSTYCTCICPSHYMLYILKHKEGYQCKNTILFW